MYKTSSWKHTSIPGLTRILWILAYVLLPVCQAKSFFHYGQYVTPRDPSTTESTSTTPAPEMRDIVIGPCRWVIGRTCPDHDIRFYLYTRRNPVDRQCLHIDETLDKSNLTNSNFNPRYQTKIIIHGYNADMFMNTLQRLRQEYLMRNEYNIIYVDWSILAPGPCYFSAVHNTKHAGACVAQLVERILETGSSDMHVIGFSLGAQLANYIARNLGSFQLPRITGLDPAMPLFITAGVNDKLDPSDATFVDVIHTNAFVQGKIERCGHADFYMNGGIMQPGCNKAGWNPFACSHQRSVEYFQESIRSRKGFWGWACSSYLSYLLGMCPPTNYLLEAGEDIKPSTKGMFLIETNDTAPYALGKWTDLPTLGKHIPASSPITITIPPTANFQDPLLRQVDKWNKLDMNFNNIERPPAHSDIWTSFSEGDTEVITNNDYVRNSVEDVENAESVEKGHGTHVEWQQYRHNLTNGHIENSIFKVPHIVVKKVEEKINRQPRLNEIN